MATPFAGTVMEPDLPEAKDQFGMLWFESEYVIDTAAKWIVVGNALPRQKPAR